MDNKTDKEEASSSFCNYEKIKQISVHAVPDLIPGGSTLKKYYDTIVSPTSSEAQQKKTQAEIDVLNVKHDHAKEMRNIENEHQKNMLLIKLNHEKEMQTARHLHEKSLQDDKFKYEMVKVLHSYQEANNHLVIQNREYEGLATVVLHETFKGWSLSGKS